MQWKNSPGGPIFDYIRVYAKITPGGPMPARFNPFIDMDKVWIGFSSAKARFFLLLDWGRQMLRGVTFCIGEDWNWASNLTLKP